jgi:hypothetical protein
MSEFKQRILAALLPASALVLTLGLAARADTVRDLSMDRTADVMGVNVACTGVGQGEEHEARWQSYPVKLEAVGGYGQYLANEQLTVSKPDGAQVLRVKCDAPWVLMQLEPGRYRATMSVANAPARNVDFTVPRAGQRDVVVRFPGLMAGHEQTAM